MDAPPPPPPPPPPPLPSFRVPPPPPPPPPPVGEVAAETALSAEQVTACCEALISSCRLLEQARCQYAELEACMQLGSHVLYTSASTSTTMKQSAESQEASNRGDQLPLASMGVQQVVEEIQAQYPGDPDTFNTIRTTTAAGNNSSNRKKQRPSFPPPGQWGRAVQTSVLAGSLKRVATLAADITSQQAIHREILQLNAKQAKQAPTEAWMACFDERYKEIKAYHARHGFQHLTSTAEGFYKRARLASDGFDLPSTARPWWSSMLAESMVEDEAPTKTVTTIAAVDPSIGGAATVGDQLSSSPLSPPLLVFTPAEVLGKYLDLDQTSWFEAVNKVRSGGNSDSKNNNKPLQYTDLLQLLLQGGVEKLAPEAAKLEHRKVYGRFLQQLQNYLLEFLAKTMPLLNVDKELIEPAKAALVQEWSQTGGYAPAWQAKQAEAAWAQSLVMISTITATGEEKGDDGDDKRKNESVAEAIGIDLTPYENAEALAEAIDGDRLKAELGRLGLKCGGTVLDRAKRLMLTKNKERSDWPPKILAKGGTAVAANNNSANPKATTSTTPTSRNERRIDLALREALVTALLDQVRPTLEATLRRTERRQGQTLKEREQELQEDLYGSQILETGKKKKDSKNNDEDDDEDEDDEEAPIYNPKNVPLDWDGKPIPYWLFKLHGLNHYYPCEICGGESFRGRRNFELHFADAKHALGMKRLGIPNTKHFHGVTSIDDAQALWKTLQDKLSEQQFDPSQHEEYEDSNGNVLTRTTYEDLARQGML